MSPDANRWLTPAAAVLLALGGAVAGYQLAPRQAAMPASAGGSGATPMAAGSAAMAAGGAVSGARPGTGGGAADGSLPQAPRSGRRVLYWYDPMKPGQHFDQPGKSPFMDMELQPQYADDDAALAASDAGAGGRVLRIDPALTDRLGVRVARVTRGVVVAPVAATASVQFNDRLVAVVQARAAGFVERAYARAPGDVVPAGAPLIDLMLPEWAGAQAEFLAVARTGDLPLTGAARQRLRLLGMPEEVITKVEASGQVEATQTVTAPIGGVIQSLDVRAGMAVAAGAPLARINGLGSVWLEAAVPEADAAQLAPGMRLSASFAAWPGETFRGIVQAVLPEASAETRTVRVRAEVANRGGRLRPGMFGQAQLQARGSGETLQVPSEAVIRTGVRNVVMLARGGGSYEPVEVRLGQEGQGQVAVLSGLHEGDQVVASGAFLIDSEASLKGVMTRLAPPAIHP